MRTLPNTVFPDYHIIIDTSSDYYYCIVGGLVSVMQPVERTKAFASDADYVDYKKQYENCVVNEKKLYPADLMHEDAEVLKDPLMLLPNSLKIKFTILEEMAVLRGKDAFGELSLKPKQPMYRLIQYHHNLTL